MSFSGIGDSQWHYSCVDLTNTFGVLFPTTSTIYQVRIELKIKFNNYIFIKIE